MAPAWLSLGKYPSTAKDRGLQKGPRAKEKVSTVQVRRSKARNRAGGLVRGPGKERTKDGAGRRGGEAAGNSEWPEAQALGKQKLERGEAAWKENA